MAPPDIAFEFAIENFESISFDQMPFAVHAWEKFAPENIKRKIQEFNKLIFNDINNLIIISMV